MKGLGCFILVILAVVSELKTLVGQTLVSNSPYRFQHFNMDDGLPVETFESLAQDSLGFMWMQHNGGLCRFDGYNFKAYRHDPHNNLQSLPSGRLGPIFRDPTGNIWITAHTTTKGFPVTRYELKTNIFTTYRPDLGQGIVHGFAFDKKNPTIWFKTIENGIYSFNFRTGETRHFINATGDTVNGKKNNTVLCISDRDSCLLIGSANGLWRFDKRTMAFSRPPCNARDSTILYHTNIWNIEEGLNANPDDVWLSLDRNISNIDRHFEIIRRLEFPKDIYSTGYDRDKNGVFWFITFENGLFRYDPGNNSFINIRAIAENTNSLKSNRINGIKIDRDQNMWLATPHGISVLTKEWLHFHNFTYPGRIDESTVVHTRNQDFLVIGSTSDENIDISISPITDGHLDSLRFTSLTKFSGVAVHSFASGKHDFWISVYGQGIAHLPIEPGSGMVHAGSAQFISHDPGNENTISSNFTTSIFEDPLGYLWVGTRGAGLNKVNLKMSYGSKGSVTRYSHDANDPNSLCNDIVWNYYQEKGGTGRVVTDECTDILQNERFEHCFKGDITPIFIFKSKQNDILIGSVDGLYKAKRNSAQENSFSLNPLLNTDEILRIQEDRSGGIWVSSVKGMTCYRPKGKLAIKFNEKNGFEHSRATNPFNKEGQTSSGVFALADLTGITLFDPSSLRIDTARISPVLTSLKIDNVDTPAIEERHDSDSSRRNVSVLKNLVLSYQHNNFTLEFAAMQLTSPDKNVYRHKLEGYDEEWIESAWKNRTATYTNLDAGTYTFKVMATNHQGIWGDEKTILTVRILPPPWKTWWAYSLYAAACIGLLFLWRRYDIKRVKLKHRAEHLTELDQLKSRFFANISHEFRTPITLILGPLKELYNGTSQEDARTVLGPVIRNGNRLLRLINQLLDLSKAEAGKVKLQTRPMEFVEFLRQIASSYESLAVEKRIRYFFYPEVLQLTVYLDEEKIDKVVHNILSNAFKFTNANGEVTLHLKVNENKAVICVKDTGIGIPASELNKVFDRFYQVDSSQTREYEGSGLGMALAKELMELHHGTLSVESMEGKGSTFTACLPLGKDHLEKDQIMNAPDAFQSSYKENQHFNPEIGADTIQASSDHPVLLIVEDNHDMRKYIRKTLSEYYHIREATNGKEGLKKAEQDIPDLIISDVMMPEMDGYALCEQIKNREQTSHIPVILLTARVDRESKLTGLGTGADDYLFKPFDADELKLIVKNRIEERRKMRERFARELTLEPTHIQISSLDEKFLQRTMALIEAHLDDEDFSIEEFSQEAGYSRMQFYRKIKSLSGQTPSLFVRTIRLKRGAQLLLQRSDNVTQIAYRVGFRSVAYFNQCFKEQFGTTPGQFAKAGQSKS